MTEISMRKSQIAIATHRAATSQRCAAGEDPHSDKAGIPQPHLRAPRPHGGWELEKEAIQPDPISWQHAQQHEVGIAAAERKRHRHRTDYGGVVEDRRGQSAALGTGAPTTAMSFFSSYKGAAPEVCRCNKHRDASSPGRRRSPSHVPGRVNGRVRTARPKRPAQSWRLERVLRRHADKQWERADVEEPQPAIHAMPAFGGLEYAHAVAKAERHAQRLGRGVGTEPPAAFFG